MNIQLKDTTLSIKLHEYVVDSVLFSGNCIWATEINNITTFTVRDLSEVRVTYRGNKRILHL